MKDAIAALQDERRRAGQAPLPEADKGISVPERIAPGGAIPAAMRRGHTRQTIIEGMALAVKHLDGGQLDQRSLKHLAKKYPGQGIPGYTTIHRHCTKHPYDTFETLREEAERLARERGVIGRRRRA